MKISYLLLFLLIATPVVTLMSATTVQADSPESSKHEFRSIWLTTAWALDWPSGTGAANHQQQMLNILDQHVDQNMNAVVFQASARGDAYYESERLPWATNLTGSPGLDPGWDPLQFLIDEAGKRGLEVHAWFNAYTVTYNSHNDSPATSDIPNVRFTNPEWLETDGWMNPAYPDAREWHVANVIEMVENYDVDAVHFDRIRYPSGGFTTDQSTMNDHNPENIGNIADWRRHNVTEFVRLVHEGIQEVKPWVKIGVTPLGHYDSGSTDGWGAGYGYSGTFQDTRYWAEAGYIDYIAPQIYWDIGTSDPPRFTYIANDWVVNRRNDRHLYIGIAAYKSNVRSELGAQIDSVRSVGAEGQLYFRNDNVSSYNFSNSYANKAIVPPMSWRSMSEPNRIRDFAYDTDGNDITLSWTEPEPRRGEENPYFRYVIYRADQGDVFDHEAVVNDPANIIAMTRDTMYSDVMPSGGDIENVTYYVTALTRNNVEGDFEFTEVTPVSAGDIAAVPSSFSLEQNYPNPFNPTTSINFEIPATGNVRLTVYDVTGREVATLVDEVRSSGSHTVNFDASGLSSGVYIYRLNSDGQQMTRRMTLIK